MPAFAAEYAPWPTLPINPAPDDVLMMRASTGAPAFDCARQYSLACRVGAKCPLRCTRMTASHSSSAAVNNIRSRRKPALLTSTSSPPNVSSARCTSACAPSQSAMSSPLATASPPAARISSTTACAGPVSCPPPSLLTPRSFTTTRAPFTCERKRVLPPDPAARTRDDDDPTLAEHLGKIALQHPQLHRRLARGHA